MPDEALRRPESGPEPSRAARRLSPTRWIQLRSERTLLVVFLTVTVSLSLAVVRWPAEVPISLLFPVVVLAALLLTPVGSRTCTSSHSSVSPPGSRGRESTWSGRCSSGSRWSRSCGS